MEVIGLTQKAIDYLYKNSKFTKFNTDVLPISCGYNDGLISMQATMYKKEKIDDDTIIGLFEYSLKNGVAQEVLQKVENDKIYLCLKIKNRRKFKWELKGD
jgi:hypothetical protein